MPDLNNTQYAGRPDFHKLRNCADVPVAAGVAQHFDAPIRQSLINVDASVTFTKAGSGAGAYSTGALKILDLPEGSIALLGAVSNLTIAIPEVVADTGFHVSVGTVTKVVADAAPTTTEENVMATAAYTAASGVITATGKPKGTWLVSDGTSTPIDLYLNLFSSTEYSGTITLKVSGTVLVTWVPLGDPS
jgi:hypothetical protein